MCYIMANDGINRKHMMTKLCTKTKTKRSKWVILKFILLDCELYVQVEYCKVQATYRLCIAWRAPPAPNSPNRSHRWTCILRTRRRPLYHRRATGWDPLPGTTTLHTPTTGLNKYRLVYRLKGLIKHGISCGLYSPPPLSFRLRSLHPFVCCRKAQRHGPLFKIKPMAIVFTGTPSSLAPVINGWFVQINGQFQEEFDQIPPMFSLAHNLFSIFHSEQRLPGVAIP